MVIWVDRHDSVNVGASIPIPVFFLREGDDGGVLFVEGNKVGGM